MNLLCGCGLASLSRADVGLISSDLFLCYISLNNHFVSLLLFSGAVILVSKDIVVAAGVLMIFRVNSELLNLLHEDAYTYQLIHLTMIILPPYNIVMTSDVASS